MARENIMQSAIFVTCLLQVLVGCCQALETNATHNANVSDTNISNASIATAPKSNISDININQANISDSNIIQSNSSINDVTENIVNVSNINESNANISMEAAAESSVSEEVVLTGTPVMSYCINDTAETSSCMMKMLNLTMECANETAATQDDVDIAMRMEIPSSDTGKCLVRCLLKHRGVMSSEGAFSPSATVEYLTDIHKNDSLQLEFQKLADYCFGKLKLQPMSSLDTCQFAYDIALCTEEYHKTLFLRNPAMAPPVNAITTP